MSSRINKIVYAIAIGLYLGFLVLFCILSRETETREISLIGDTFIDVCKYPWTWILLVLIVANVLLYVPIGALLQRLITSKIEVILLGLLISIGIEVSQLTFSRGTFDFDDIINNFMGTIIGAYLL